MEDKRLKVRGFVDVRDDELSVCGGLNPETIKRIAKILGIVIDFIATYGEDFYKGYKKGVEGQPLFVFSK
ncbi:MAG: hypothetical protein IK041_06905 [Bacteroidales bacterium]|nr:hypothetical protein [Bacteroidales bacterium]